MGEKEEGKEGKKKGRGKKRSCKGDIHRFARRNE